MPNIKLYTSNRLEILADQLAESVRKPLSSPFKAETIVVQSRGMERWISMQLADRLGVWSNCMYYFPNQIISEIFKQIIPGSGNERIFNTEVIKWQLMRILPSCLSAKDFKSLKEYLDSGDVSFRTYQLSARIADTFDQYLTYRPEMILDWDSGKGEGWQPQLWRILMNELHLQHPPALRNIFFERLKKPENIDFNLLPERITIFGISSMPVFHMDVLAAISDHIDVNLFFMNPCREYWADIHPEKKIAGTLNKYDNTSMRELHLEKGNSLLASMGKLGSDFLSIIMKNDIQEFPIFTEAGKDSLLSGIQSDILNMIDRGASGENKRVEFSPGQIRSDTSIKVHSCHSPMREVEVLYNNLLDMFNNDPELEPGDILVMMPDVELYSPYISAVFDINQEERRRIPFSIADRSIRKDSRAIDAFFAILDLKDKRFGAGEVLDILGCTDVLNKFGLSISDLELVRGWIKDTNINWGIDAGHREKHGLPGFEENTWKAGIERMLLGYAIPGKKESLYGDILPFDIEGSESLVLGKFAGYFNALKIVLKSLAGVYTIGKWSQILKDIVEMFFIPDHGIENSRVIREALDRLCELEEESGYHEAIELRTVETWLEYFLREKKIKSGFIAGGVTFCEMLPMRSIPFKVICLIGMNDSAFPRTPMAVSFDLISQNPRRGDRSRRNDDRYLFLESIVSARKKVYISYAGRSIQDNSDIPPSVVVSELMDYIQQGYGVKERNIMDYICIKHPLQSFSPRYFGNNDNLFSYSAADCEASKAALSERRESRPFISGKLSESYEPEHGKIIGLNEFVKFFTNPAKYLLTTRLGIYLDDTADIMDEKEPFDVKGLEKYHIEDFICEHYLKDLDTENLYKTVRAMGLLPHGTIGEVAFKNLIPGIKDFSRRIKEMTGENALKPLDINLNISGYIISGRLDNIWPRGMILYRYADANARDRIRSWITHLALNASSGNAYPMNSMLICKDASWGTDPIDSREILNYLMEIYVKGCNELIYFFSETSLEYANCMLKNGMHEKAVKMAGKKWISNDHSKGEGSDLYYDLCFKATNPFDNNFAELSIKIFEPLLTFQKKIEI